MKEKNEISKENGSFDKDTWYVLSKIKELLRYTKNKPISYYDYTNILLPDPTKKISARAEEFVMKELQNSGVIKVNPYELTWDDYKHSMSTGPKSFVMRVTPPFISFEIVKEKFEQAYSKYYNERHSLEETSQQAENNAQFYIVKMGDEFRYNGTLIDTISKGTDYYIVFDVLYTLTENAGFAAYENMREEVRKRILKTKDFTSKKLNKFILNNLDGHNGFLHHAKRTEGTLSNGKKLIQVVRGKGIQFNNKK